MSDLLDAAAEALGTPPDLVSRSAAARAEANGTTTEEILQAWAGGAPAAAPEAPVAEPETTEETPTETPEPAPSAEAAPPPPPPVPEPAAVDVEEAEPIVEPLEPVPARVRLRTAGRIGTWTGAVLGLFAFVIAASSWSQTVSVSGEESLSPIFIAESRGVLIGVALVSVVFGALVAGFARAAAGWVNPAMELTSAKASTAWVGAGLGLVLGVAAGAILANGFGTPIEGSEGLVELPVLGTLLLMLLGGAFLGGVTSTVTQFFGVPATVDESEYEEVENIRARLGNAVGIPLAGVTLLAVLVLPFAWTLIQSNHVTSGGAAIVAIITASGVLVFASLAGSRPNIRISTGEFLVAVAGIGIVVLILFAVLNNLGGDTTAEETGGEEATAELVVS